MSVPIHDRAYPPRDEQMREANLVLRALHPEEYGRVAEHLEPVEGENRRVIWVPPGFAHGTFALEDDTIVLYECTGAHGPGEGGILWNDPALDIRWPDIPPIVSEKDRVAPTLAAWLADPRSRHFRME